MASARRPGHPAVTALTIAGSDSGGGAGVQADLKTFAALGVHGTSAITCVTAQNPHAVTAIQAIRGPIVEAQIEAAFAGFKPGAVKTGMLYSADLIRIVARHRSARPGIPWIVDPVMVATSGARLLRPSALRALTEALLPICTLVTPNLAEACVLTGEDLRDVEDLRRAARQLHDRFGCAVLVKGGHLPGPEAVDLFQDGRDELLLTAPRVRGRSTHGTGCTYSAAITDYLALGSSLPLAVQLAKDYITRALSQARRIGPHTVLEHFWKK